MGVVDECKDSNLNSPQHTDGPPYISYYSVAADSAATKHFFTIKAPITNQQETEHPIKICAANGGILESTHVGKISLPQLPPQAHHIHVVPGLATMLLLAICPYMMPDLPLNLMQQPFVFNYRINYC